MRTGGYLALLASFILFSCDPKDDPIKCLPDSINNIDGIIYNGHITLCNAQGPNTLVYETGICSVTVNADSIFFLVISTSPNFSYSYRDTLTYDCAVYEGESRVFNLHDFNTNNNMGSVHETENDIHFIINDVQCPNSSFFEGNQ